MGFAEVDPNQLESALLNLAVNARDAMPSGGTMTIETSNAYISITDAVRLPEFKAGSYVLICMTDTGSGMTPEVLERAFEPFFTTKPVGQGTGLGLSQVFGFVKQSGGHVKIYSRLGHGTTVKVYLPKAREAEIIAGNADEAVKPETPHAETILVGEDNDAVRVSPATVCAISASMSWRRQTPPRLSKFWIATRASICCSLTLDCPG